MEQIASSKKMKVKSLSSERMYPENQNKEILMIDPAHKALIQEKMKSDIFFRDENSYNKRTDCNPVNPDKIPINFESKSAWSQGLPKQKSIQTSESCRYLILNPGVKNVFKTKEEIIDNSDRQRPLAKNSILGDYIYQCRARQFLGCKEYKKYYQNNLNCFHKTKDMLNSYADLYKEYKPLVVPLHKTNDRTFDSASTPFKC